MPRKGPYAAVSPIGAVLQRLSHSRGWKQKWAQYAVFDLWNVLVGKAVAHQAQPLFFRGDVMVVGVRNHAWIQELNYLKASLLGRLRAAAPQAKLADLFFEWKPDLVLPPLPSSSSHRPVPLTAAEREWITKATAALQDDELKKSLQQLMEKATRQRRPSPS